MIFKSNEQKYHQKENSGILGFVIITEIALRKWFYFKIDYLFTFCGSRGFGAGPWPKSEAGYVLLNVEREIVKDDKLN